MNQQPSLHEQKTEQLRDLIAWFRHSSPYINVHRGRTLIISVNGEFIQNPAFQSFIHDIALLNALGVNLVLTHGARPQIEAAIKKQQLEPRLVEGLRVTDWACLQCVKETVGVIRTDIEALFSMGLANTPMAGANIQVTSGNFVIAKPLGVINGVDFQHTGDVRRINSTAIKNHLGNREIVLISPLAYSTTGEIFNLNAETIAIAMAEALKADKLLLFYDGHNPLYRPLTSLAEVSVAEAKKMMAQVPKDQLVHHPLHLALQACQRGVPRVHLLDMHIDGALLIELFTRDGLGLMLSTSPYEGMRQAKVEDVPGILELIKPLEDQGILVRRSREKLEIEIHHFIIMEREGMIIGCIALYPHAAEAIGEVACLAVHADYSKTGRGQSLLTYAEQQAKKIGLNTLVLLTTRTAHWFIERGFQEAEINSLPLSKQKFYNYQRKSKVFKKTLL